MGGSKRKKREESSPNGSATTEESTSSRPPSASGKESEKPVIRKSGRKRVAKRRSPSPSPPPPRARKPAAKAKASVPTKKAVSTATTEPPPKKVARVEPPKKELLHPKPQEKPASRLKPAPPKTAPSPKPPAPPKPPPPPPPAEESSEESDDGSRSDVSTIMSEDPPEYLNARAGVYAPLLRKRQKRQMDCIPVVTLPPRTIGGVRDQLQKTRVCNCKRSGCLKLYCDCFMAGLECTEECSCDLCKNNGEYPSARNMAIDAILMRNPNAFRPRLQPGTISTSTSLPALAAATAAENSKSKTKTPPRPEKGCKCKKSSCLKKYCECFLATHYCTRNCSCKECKNKIGNVEREKLMSGRLSKAQVEQAARQQALGSGHMSQLTHPQELMGGSTFSTADIVRANTIARGVDLFLPPSSHAVPFKLANGRPYPAVSFVRAGAIQGTTNRGNLQAAPDFKKTKKTSPSRMTPKNEKYRYETDLEKLWRVETERVCQTFTKVHKDLQQALSSQKFRVKDAPPPFNRKNAMISYRAQMTIDGVMDDTKDIISAMNRAETNALNLFDEEEKLGDESSARSASNDEAGRKRDVTGAVGLGEIDLLCSEEMENLEPSELDAASLLCEEEMDNSEDRELTDDAVRELTVLAAQETALIRQLSQIIRRKTLTLTDQRLRLVQDARQRGLKMH